MAWVVLIVAFALLWGALAIVIVRASAESRRDAERIEQMWKRRREGAEE